MSKIFKTEVLWFLGGIVLSLLVQYLSLRTFNPFPNSTLDINLKDTYFVVSNNYFFVLLFLFIFFDIYLIRALAKRFKNITINYLFLFFNGLMILTMAYLLLFWQTFSAFGSWTIYPPLSATEMPEPETNFFDNYFFIPVLILIALIVTQTVVAIRVGKMSN